MYISIGIVGEFLDWFVEAFKTQPKAQSTRFSNASSPELHDLKVGTPKPPEDPELICANNGHLFFLHYSPRVTTDNSAANDNKHAIWS